MKLKITDITPAIKHSVNTVLLAKAYAQTEREKMNAIDQSILMDAIYWSDPKRTEGKKIRIIDPKDTWRLADEEAKDFFAERDIRILKAGYKLKPGYCPALIAENLLIKTEQLLVESAEPIFGVSLQQLLCAGMAKYHKYIDLLCSLVVKLPDFKNPLN